MIKTNFFFFFFTFRRVESTMRFIDKSLLMDEGCVEIISSAYCRSDWGYLVQKLFQAFIISALARCKKNEKSKLFLIYSINYLILIFFQFATVFIILNILLNKVESFTLLPQYFPSLTTQVGFAELKETADDRANIGDTIIGTPIVDQNLAQYILTDHQKAYIVTPIVGLLTSSR